MGVIDFLDRLRQKPVFVRRQIVLATTLVLWFLIMAIWWTAVNSSSSSSTKKLISLSDALSPFKALMKTIANTGSEVQGVVSGVTEVLSSETEGLATSSAESADNDHGLPEHMLESAAAGSDPDIEWSGEAASSRTRSEADTQSTMVKPPTEN